MILGVFNCLVQGFFVHPAILKVEKALGMRLKYWGSVNRGQTREICKS